jgi:hypothetical protein
LEEKEMTLRKLKWYLVAYVVLDLLIGYAGVIPLGQAAAAQFTTVTGTVVDPHAVPYALGTIASTLVLPGNVSPTLNGQVYIPPSQASGLDLTGHFTVQLADNSVLLPAGTKWNFVVCSFQGTELPSFGTGSQCFTLAAPITISGASQDISTQLNAVATALTLPFGASSGLSCSPITNFGVVYINSTGSCVTSNTLSFIQSTNTLQAGANGGSAVGAIKANGTSSAFGAVLLTDSAGDQIQLGEGSASSALGLVIDADTALTPVNYMRWRNATTGAAPTFNSYGWEFVGGGDIQGSGSAAGFVVKNNANTTNTSPGASNSFTAGNATGTSSSPGGSNTITAGSASGGSTANNGGLNTFVSGNAGGTNGIGGDSVHTAGNGAGTGRGGNVTLNPGSGSPNGAVVVGAGNGLTLNSVAFASLPASVNGSEIFCSDCNATCTAGASTGRTCFRENGAWTH